MTPGNEASCTVLFGSLLACHKEPDSGITARLVLIGCDGRKPVVMNHVVTMKLLVPRAGTDRKDNGVVELRVRGGLLTLLAVVGVMGRGQQTVAYALVQGVPYNILHERMRFPTQTTDAAGLWWEKVSFPGLVCVDKWSHIILDLIKDFGAQKAAKDHSARLDEGFDNVVDFGGSGVEFIHSEK